jgi:hypothetical protein
MNAAEAQIRAKVRLVANDERSFGTLSTGERIAVAFVLDRYDLLQDVWGSMLEAPSTASVRTGPRRRCESSATAGSTRPDA